MMTELSIVRTAGPAPLRAFAALAEFLQGFADSWHRAHRARYLAETWLMMSDEALVANGTTRAAVTESIRSILTEGD